MSANVDVVSKQTTKTEWYAWVNVQPGTAPSHPTIHVKGTIDFGNVDDGAAIERVEEPDNPRALVLKVYEVEILIPRKPGDTTLTLEYEEPGSIDKYPSGVVVINLDGSRDELLITMAS